MSRHLSRPLKWARPCERPACIPHGRPRGAKAQGLRYERALMRAIGPAVTAGQWFEYKDSDGIHYCQTDGLIIGSSRVLIIECKLTWTLEGILSLRHLYVPVVEAAFSRLTYGIIAASRLPREHDALVVGTLDDAIRAAARSPVGACCLHWIPKTPLRAQPQREAA